MGNEDEELPISVQIANLQKYLATKIDDGQKLTNESLAAINSRIDSNENELVIHKLKTQADMSALRLSVDAVAARLGPGNPGEGSSGGTMRSYAGAAGNATVSTRASSHQDSISAQYWRSRQSARISPVEGEEEKEIWNNVQDFFFNKMRVPTTDLRKRDVVLVRRVLTARGRKSRSEVCVKFIDVETRDRIASYARNLGDFIENGKATATFRHDIPSHLAGVHKTLLQYGFAMGKKHGRGFKRNIRFDDTALTFCIDIMIPANGNKDWVTVTHDQALVDRRRIEMQKNKELGDNLLSTSTTSEQSGGKNSTQRRKDIEQSKSTGPGSAGVSTSSGGSTSSSASWGSQDAWNMDE